MSAFNSKSETAEPSFADLVMGYLPNKEDIENKTPHQSTNSESDKISLHRGKIQETLDLHGCTKKRPQKSSKNLFMTA